MDEIIVDIFTFRKEAGLDYNTLKELYFTFADELKQEKKELNTCYTQNKGEELLPIVHKMKGIASSYRAPAIFNNAIELEKRLKNKDFKNLDSDMDELNKAIDQVTDTIALFFQD